MSDTTFRFSLPRSDLFHITALFTVSLPYKDWTISFAGWLINISLLCSGRLQ